MIILNVMNMMLIFFLVEYNFKHLLAQEYEEPDFLNYAETEPELYYHVKEATQTTGKITYTKRTLSKQTSSVETTTRLLKFKMFTQESQSKTTDQPENETFHMSRTFTNTKKKPEGDSHTTLHLSERTSITTGTTRSHTSSSVSMNSTMVPLVSNTLSRKEMIQSDSSQKDYSNYSVLLITPGSTEQLNEILQFEYKNKKYSIWSHRRVLHAPLIVLLPPTDTSLRDILRQRKIDYTILIENLQTVFDYELGKSIKQIHPSLTGISFNMYLRYDFVMDYLTHLPRKYPEIARLIKIGKTVEDRDIMLIEVKDPDPPEETIGAVLIQAGLHGREWLGVSAALYLINQLVEHASANNGMFDGIFWYILPIFNADGYEYSHTYDRLWKNNRRQNANCSGIDLDRNFKVGENADSSRKYNCTNLYGGDELGSEPETRALMHFLRATREIIKVYVSLHSGDPFIGYPWAHKSERSADYDEIVELTTAIRRAIEEKDNSTKFTTGRLYSLCGMYDGAAVDWAKQEGILYPIMISLKGGSLQGFDVPSESIFDSVVAAFEGIRAIADYLHIAENKSYVVKQNHTIMLSDSASSTVRTFVMGILILLILI